MGAHGNDATTHGSPDSPVGKPEPPGILTTKRPSPIQSLVRISLTLLLLGLIFGVVIPSFADYGTVWAAITSLSPLTFLLLAGITIGVEVAKAAAPATLLPGLDLRRSFLADEASAAVSNTIPGPSGTAMRYLTYRRYGLSAADFGRSTVVNSIWNNALLLVAPSIIVPLLAAVQPVPGRVLGIALVGLVISVVALLLIVAIIRSERFAYQAGALVGRAVNWARGLRNRPPAADVGHTVVRFRHDTLDLVKRRWPALTGVIVVKYVATYLVLLISLRALGSDRVTLTALEVLAVYAFVRLLTLIEITPGGLGVVEALYIAALSWATEGAGQDQIVAAVLVFRMFTYLGPILIGAACYLILTRRFRDQRRDLVNQADVAAGSPEPAPISLRSQASKEVGRNGND